MDKCIQALPSTGSGIAPLLYTTLLLLGIGIVAIRTSRHHSGRLMAVGLPIISVLSFSAPSTQTIEDCPPKEATATTLAPTATTVSPTTIVETTETTVAASCTSAPQLAAEGEPTIQADSDPVVVSNGTWVEVPNCAITFTYKWQYTDGGGGSPPGPKTWYDYPGLTSSSTSYSDLYEPIDAPFDCVTYARAVVTATNDAGSTSIATTDEVELCS